MMAFLVPTQAAVFTLTRRLSLIPQTSQPEYALALESRLQGMVKGKLIKPKGGVLVRSVTASSTGNNADAEDIADRMARKVAGQRGQGGSASQRGGGGGGGGGGGRRGGGSKKKKR